MNEAEKIKTWVSWVLANKKMDPTYMPKALMAVLVSDGMRTLSAVLRELKIVRAEQLIEAMLEPGTTTGARTDAGGAPKDDQINAPAHDEKGPIE